MLIKNTHFARWRMNIIWLASLLVTAVLPSTLFAAPVIDYRAAPSNHLGPIIDVRPTAACEKSSLAGARCLPVSDFFGPNKRLANFSGILWLLGTAGLNGSEHVLVVGGRRNAKEAVAGLLFLAGQKSITVLSTAIDLLDENKRAPGEERSKTREKVYQAEMRNDRIVLRSDLAALVRGEKVPLVIDGRSEGEYWGSTIRAARGGHIPGAQHLAALSPGAAKKPQWPFEPASPPIAYGHNSYSGLIYLARLEATGLPARLYLEGWVGWASDGALPADGLSFSETRQAVTPAKKPLQNTAISISSFTALALCGATLAIGGFFVGRCIRPAAG